MAAAADLKQHLIDLQQEQLNVIAAGNYDAYAAMCHESVTCFESEARGHLVQGMKFHEVYFKNKQTGGNKTLNNTMSAPTVSGGGWSGGGGEWGGGRRGERRAAVGYVDGWWRRVQRQGR
jgi:hypothetical protein